MQRGAQRTAGLGLAILFGLAACAADPAPQPAFQPAPAQPSLAVTPATLAVRDGVAPPLTAAAGATNPMSVTASRAAEPGRLIGLSRDAVLQTLGRPVFVREDGPSQLWRYPWAECYLEVFLFRDQGIYQVTHAELRQRLGAAGGAGNCSDRGSAARRARPAS